MSVTRRNFIQAAVASALASVSLKTFGHMGRGGLPPPVGGFYLDPYSSYTSVIADQTYSGTQGAVGTRNWNGGTITAPVYGPDANGTWQPALTAAAGTNGGASVRVCVLAGQAWNFGPGNGTSVQGTTIPANLTTTATSRYVIQGDPSASPAQMPTVTINGTSTNSANALWIGGIYLGPAYNNQHVTVRKIRFTGFSNTNGCAAIVLYGDQESGNGGSNDDAEICFCQADTFTCGGAQGESGLVYQTGRNGTQHVWVHHNKAFNIQMPSGSASPVDENHAWVGSYGGIWTIEYNEFYGAYNGVRFKGCTSTVPNGNIVRYNYIHDVLIGLSFQDGGGADGPNTIQIYGNLFGWEHYNDAVFYDPTYNSQTIYPVAFADGVLDQQTIGDNNQFYNNTVSEVYGASGKYAFSNLNSQNWLCYNNVMLGLSLSCGSISYYNVITAFTFTGGTGYSNGTYTNLPLSGGSGSGASCNVTVSGGVMGTPTMTLSQGQHSYAVNDVLNANTVLSNGVSTVTFAGGSGYTNGTYSNVALTGGTGARATADITVSGGAITAVNIVNQGGGYAVNDSLSANGLGSGTGFAITVTAITGTGSGGALTVTAVGGAPGYTTLDYNSYWQPQWWNYSSTGYESVTTFAAWQSSVTNNPTWLGLTANPDTHSLYVPNLSSPYNTLAGNFPNYSTPGVTQYALASGSPMSTAAQGGGAMGYDAANCGAGW